MLVVFLLVILLFLNEMNFFYLPYIYPLGIKLFLQVFSMREITSLSVIPASIPMILPARKAFSHTVS